MEDITIPDTVSKIGWGAFSGCRSLKRVIIPDSVKEIGEEAFSGCTSLEEIRISSSVNTIGRFAFNGCPSVSFDVDERNESFSSKDGALFDKDGKTLILGYAMVRNGCCSIPDSVTKIGSGAFVQCGSLNEVHMPESVTEIDDEAFILSFSVTQPNTLACAHATDNPGDRRKREGWACDSSCANKTKPKPMASIAYL